MNYYVIQMIVHQIHLNMYSGHFPSTWQTTSYRSKISQNLKSLKLLTCSSAPASRLQVGKINLLAAQRREQHILVMVSSMVSCYMLCWMPYGIMALVATFGRSGLVTPMASVVPSILAKFSTVVNPVIYIFFNNQVRVECRVAMNEDLSVTVSVACVGWNDCSDVSKHKVGRRSEWHPQRTTQRYSGFCQTEDAASAV